MTTHGPKAGAPLRVRNIEEWHHALWLLLGDRSYEGMMKTPLSPPLDIRLAEDAGESDAGPAIEIRLAPDPSDGGRP